MILVGDDPGVCEELSVRVAAGAIAVAQGVQLSRAGSTPSSCARVARVVRMIENEEDIPQDLNSLALVARLSPYHFLRTFEEVTGTTPSSISAPSAAAPGSDLFTIGSHSNFGHRAAMRLRRHLQLQPHLSR